MILKKRLAIGVIGFMASVAIFAVTYFYLTLADNKIHNQSITTIAKAPSRGEQHTPITVISKMAKSKPPLITKLPSQILDLKNWRLTAPVDNDNSGAADQIDQPALAAFSNNFYFKVSYANDAVLFAANAGGATTKGSHYPRAELREMEDNGRDKASWSSTSGRHVMNITEAFMRLTSAKPEIVGAQIHDDTSDVIMVRLEGHHLFAQSDGKNIGDIDNAYVLGTRFNVQIIAEDGHIKVSYNGIQKVDFIRNSSGLYFKAGCYLQTNTSRGDTSDAWGQVAIYSLEVSHS